MTTQPPPESAEPARVCTYELYPGKCGQPASEGDRCPEHAALVCINCGKRAVIACDYEGQFVCGWPLCAGCVHDEKTGGHKAKSPAPVATDTAGPVCKRCNDTHRFEGHNGTMNCTSCPVPCQKCRKGGIGAYCEKPRCLCECHRKPATPAPAGDAEVSHEQARSLADALPAAFHTRGALLAYISQQEARQQQAETHRILNQREWENGGRELAEYLSAHPDALAGNGVRGEAVRLLKLADARQQQAEQRIAEYKASEADWREKLRGWQSALQMKDKAIAELKSHLLELGPDLDEANAERYELSQKLEAITEDRRVQRVKAADAEIALTEERSLTAELRGKLEAAEREARQNARLAGATRRVASGLLEAFPQHFEKNNNALLDAAHEARACLAELWPGVPGPQFPPSQPPPASPLTPDDVRTIAREVIAEVAGRAASQAKRDELWSALPVLQYVLDVAKGSP